MFVQDSIVCLHQSLFIQSDVISNALVIINNPVMLSLHLSLNFSLFCPRRLFFWRWIWVFSWLQVETAVLTAREAPLTLRCP